MEKNFCPDKENVNINIHRHSVQPANPSGDKFLFYFVPTTLAREACCGASLKTGAQITVLIFIAASLSNLLTSWRMNDTIGIIISFLVCALYIVAGVSVFYSTISFNYLFSHVGYFVYAIVFLASLLDSVLVNLLIFIGFFTPFGNDNIKGGLIYLLAMAIVLSFHLYLVWIIFSFSIHLKHGRIHIVTGKYHIRYEDIKFSRPVQHNQTEQVGQPMVVNTNV